MMYLWRGHENLQKRMIIGHRGAAGHAPENTLLSFATALNLGAHMIELDVQETLDGHLVCIHDRTLDRTTDGSGAVSEMTLQDLRTFDAGLGEKIPLLSEVLDMARNRLKVNIELKTLGVEKRVFDLVNFREMAHEVMVSSFFHDTLIAMKEISSEVETAILINAPKSNLIPYTLELGFNAINPRFSLVSHEMIEEAHNNSLKIYPWTVNDSSQMLELLNLGADGIITDYPNVGVEALKRYSESGL
jgi:glycerophosphoryl diester phosphodiesterase